MTWLHAGSLRAQVCWASTDTLPAAVALPIASPLQSVGCPKISIDLKLVAFEVLSTKFYTICRVLGVCTMHLSKC